MPTSNIYEYLEGRVPNPALTYAKIAEIIEIEERERINKEIGERRTRLGARIGEVTAETKREVMENSPLETIYSSIIDWTNDDDQRRSYEEKLLQRAYDTLIVLPLQRKEPKRIQVQKLAEGFVILKHHFALAWKVVFDWKDVETIEGLDVLLLRDYVDLFPDDGVTKVIIGYMDGQLDPIPVQLAESNHKMVDESQMDQMTAEDRLFHMIQGSEESSRSIIAQRLMAEYCLHLEEYFSAVEYAKKTVDLIKFETQLSGLNLQNVLDAAHVTLATALVHHESPRNHPEARKLFEEIQLRKPTSASALIGLGLILEEEEDYKSAIPFLSRALECSPDIKIRVEIAWCVALGGDYKAGLEELERCLLQMEVEGRSKDLRSKILYRMGMCLWNLDPSKAARKDRNGAYAHFISSLQANLTFAPAYTSLGVYYADYAKDKKRARKCFQKAFEISASEVIAAQRLASIFADQKQWDLVELVAQRVIESGMARAPPGSKKKSLSWPFAALAVCQLNEQNYTKSIISFQSAIRISPEEFHCWVGLGESYYNSGRFVAATKAFEQAQKHEANHDGARPQEIWFSNYMLANVRRELGEYDEALLGYERVLSSRPKELGVEIALIQAHVESAWQSIELGFFGHAAESAAKAVTIAGQIIEHHPNVFNTWKAIGDACAAFSWTNAYMSDFPADDVRNLLYAKGNTDVYDLLADIDNIRIDMFQSGLTSKAEEDSLSTCLFAAILAQKRAIYVCKHDIHAQAVAWYNLGWTEYRASICLEENLTRRKSHYLKAAVRCFKRAIELEAGNSEFWNSLGVVTAELNPKISQHAYVRSLHLNDRSAKVWTNLGTLYLLQNDNQLANQAFTRAQSADPEYAYAWVGQGILATLLGNKIEAQSLFTHAFEVSDSSCVVAKRLYITSTFDQMISSKSLSQDNADLSLPLFALNQLRSQTKADTVYEHLRALLTERTGAYAEGRAALESVCAKVELEYELQESSLSLSRFAQAKADLARIQLAEHNFPEAALNAEISLDLSADDDSALFDPDIRRRLRVSAHLTPGLAYHFTGLLDKAIWMFRTALEETNSNPDVTCVLAQVLWTKKGAKEREVAREQLFDCVEKHNGHVGATTLLAVIALLDSDNETLEAVTADLRSLQTQTEISILQQSEISHLLAAIAMSNPNSDERRRAETSEAASTIMLTPSQPQGWSQLAELAGETQPYAADMALLTALRGVPPRGTLDNEDLCKVYAGTRRTADAQTGIMVAPWREEGWKVLAT